MLAEKPGRGWLPRDGRRRLAETACCAAPRPRGLRGSRAGAVRVWRLPHTSRSAPGQGPRRSRETDPELGRASPDVHRRSERGVAEESGQPRGGDFEARVDRGHQMAGGAALEGGRLLPCSESH